MLVGKQGADPCALPVGVQVGAGVQDTAGGVERIARVTAVTVDGLLHAAAAIVHRVAGQAHRVEWVHDRDGVGEFLCRRGFEAGEAVHRHDLHAVAEGLVAVGEPGLERLLGPARDHVQQPGRSGAAPDRGEVDDHRDELVAAAGVPPTMIVHADDLHAVEPGGVVDQHPAAFGQDRVVGGVPGHRQGFGDAGDGHVLAHQGFQRPSQRAPRQPGSRLGRLRRVLPPHVTAAGAPVAAHRHQKRRGSPPERFVRQLAGHAVPR